MRGRGLDSHRGLQSRLADREARQAKQARGYAVAKIGEGERMLPAAITQQFTLRADGVLEPVIEGLTRPIGLTVTHAGICKVNWYTLDMP
jgi:hypothetical protein